MTDSTGVVTFPLPATPDAEREFGRLLCRLGARCFDEHMQFSLNCFPDEPGEVSLDLSGCDLSAAHERHGEEVGPMGRRRAAFGMVQAADVNTAVEQMIDLLPRLDLDSRLPRTVQEQEQLGHDLCVFMRATLERGLGFSFSMTFPPLAEPRFGAHVYAPRGVRPSHRSASNGQIADTLAEITAKLEASYPEPVTEQA